MPVASSAQKEPQLPAGLHQLLQAAHHGHNSAMVQDAASYIPDIVSQYQGSNEGHTQQAFFNTQSPPLLNLSPNLSSSSDLSQRSSPVYDLRESTRRRSAQGKIFFLRHIVQRCQNLEKLMPKLWEKDPSISTSLYKWGPFHISQ